MTACKVGALAEALPFEDLAVLTGWLDTGTDATGRRVPATTMAAALTAEGHTVSPTAIKDHRGRRCVCYRK